MGIEPRTKTGNHTRPFERSALSRAHGEGWENCLIANVTQWNVFGGLGVVTD